MSTDTDRAWLDQHGLHVTMGFDGNNWYVVRNAAREVISEARSYALAVRRARAALRKRQTVTA